MTLPGRPLQPESCKRLLLGGRGRYDRGSNTARRQVARQTPQPTEDSSTPADRHCSTDVQYPQPRNWATRWTLERSDHHDATA
jgi:hypothetical protein